VAELEKGTITVKRGLAQMLKGGVIMDVVTPEQALIAQEAGAVAVMALERIPADIRAAGGVARMSSLELIQGIMDAVTIPVMAKVRIGHFAEAQVLQSIGIDYIDESEVLTPADDLYQCYKHGYKVPFVCGAKYLGEALRRIAEGVKISDRNKTADTLENAFSEYPAFPYRYQTGHHGVFMQPETRDQVHVGAEILGDMAPYLQEGMEVRLASHNGVAISLTIPARATFEVVETEPAMKGQTASGSFKPAKLSNGVRTMVPTHIVAGTRIVVLTEDGSYVERAKD